MPRGVYPRVNGKHGAPRKGGATGICKGCGTGYFVPYPSQLTKKIYCSHECAIKSVREQRHQKVFDFIVEYKQTHDGIAPSFEDINIACGMKSPTVNEALKSLRSAGRIQYDKKRPRYIEVVGGRWFPPGRP